MAVSIRKARLGAKAQVVLPKEARRALGLKPGDTLAFVIDGADVRSCARRPRATIRSSVSRSVPLKPIARAMPIFDRFDVVSVPFPDTDRPIRQRRPALVVSQPSYEQKTGLLWVVMITAAEKRQWPGDVAPANARRAGLSIPSVVRPAKIATIEAAQASRIGSIGAAERQAVRTAISQILA